MTRVYLEEDLSLIRKYFPGAAVTTLTTPFDLNLYEDPWVLRADDRDEFFEPKWLNQALSSR